MTHRKAVAVSQCLKFKNTRLHTHKSTLTHLPTPTPTHARIQAIPLHSTLTFSFCVSVKQAEQFVMSESLGAAIQQKVKRSVGKGWRTKPSLPPSVSLSHSHTLGRKPLHQHPPQRCHLQGPHLEKIESR